MSERRASMGDKVYRGDVIKFIRNNITLSTFMKRTVKTADEACWDLCDKLNYVPAINEEQHEQHWIPVTERLPEKNGAYLITAEGFPVSIKFYSADSYGWGEEWRRVITAWMPLPEPYQKGDAE